MTWHKKNGKLDAGVLFLPSGSLWIRNVSLHNQGIYSCTASNNLGKSTASSVLQVYGGFTLNCAYLLTHKGILKGSTHVFLFFLCEYLVVVVCTGVYPTEGRRVVPVSQELNRRRVLMASRRGTSVFVKPGDSLRIGGQR